MRRRGADGNLLADTEWERAPGEARQLVYMFAERKPDEDRTAAPIRERVVRWWRRP